MSEDKKAAERGSDAQAIIDAMRAFPLGEVHRIDERTYLLVAEKEGTKVVDITDELDTRLPHPRQRAGTVVADTLDAFCALAARHATPRTVVYVSGFQLPVRFAAVIDDNEPGEGLPGWREHRIIYEARPSDEWKAWLSSSGQLLGQQAFAEQLDERVLDLLDPASSAIGDATRARIEAMGVKPAAPPAIRALARDLTVRVSAKVREARNLQSGEAQLAYEESHHGDDGRPLTIPGAFLIAIPVHAGGPRFVFVARLRYRLKDGAVAWSYSLACTANALAEVLAEEIAAVRAALPGVLVVEGRPE